jgi:RND family efflux transporter MFP subunit
LKIGRLAAVLLAATLLSCGGPDRRAASEAEPAPPAGTPVAVAEVALQDVSREVSAPGQTRGLSQQTVRAPFTGTLTELSVTDGDRVRRGQVLGVLVSRDSEAALSGAREMERQARTPSERRDAERALELARRWLVEARLESPVEGRVLTHAASAGDRIAEDQPIVSISDEDSIVFEAQVPQPSLPEIHPGQTARVDLAGRRDPIAGAVHDVLAAANPSDLTAVVRIDLKRGHSGLAVGLFGTARITVGRRASVPVVPLSAVLRDDVTGLSRLALVTPEGKARWIEVTTGWRQGDVVEIAAPELEAGRRVIVSGQVGLPDGAPVTVRK